MELSEMVKKVFSAGFSAEKSASEPLTKDKLNLCSNPRCDDHYIVELDDLKSALEEFEKLLIHHKPDNPKYMMRLLKKAFPAIYEEKG